MFKVQGSSVVLVMHKHPDVDAYASACIVSDVIKQKYPSLPIYVYVSGNVRSFFLKPVEQIGTVIVDQNELPENCTVYLLDHHDQDYSELENWGHPNIKEIIVIDHHFDVLKTKKKNETEDKPKPAPMRMFVDTNRICTTDLIFEQLQGMNSVEITKEIATNIYLGIFSDCMRFSLPVTVDIHRRIVLLVDKYGAEVNKKCQLCAARTLQWYKEFSEWWHLAKFYNVESGIIVLDVDHPTYKRLVQTGEKPYSILFDLLACKGAKHLIALFHNTEKTWIIKILSRFDNVIKEGFPKAFKDKIYTTYAFNHKQVGNIKQEAIAILENWNRRSLSI